MLHKNLVETRPVAQMVLLECILERFSQFFGRFRYRFLDYSEWILRVLLLDPGIIFDCFGIDFAQMLVQCCRDSVNLYLLIYPLHFTFTRHAG